MGEVKNSFCRICLNGCALKVEVENGRVRQVNGDTDNPHFEGYTCVKGREQAHYLYHPDRLLHSLKRKPDGDFQQIPIAAAMDEIAERLRKISADCGANAIASYIGCMMWASYPSNAPMLAALMDTLGSEMRFDPETIDKGGKNIAAALHGNWMAPSCGFDDPDVTLLIGINPLVTYTGLPAGNPGKWLKLQAERGMKLIVIDPRRSDVAMRADQHLRPRPGFDIDILACFIHLILSENLIDERFVEENVTGVDALRRTVAAFDPLSVAERTGVEAGELVLAARTLARQRRGYIMAGTGPHMSTQGSLLEYLVLSLQSLCGYWLRAGETVKAAPVLLPARNYKAQTQGPDKEWASGRPLGKRGLYKTAAGLPVTVLPELMLTEGDDRVRALICVGANPAAVIPDQRRTVAGLKALDLFVQVDPWMSRSSELADYVIAPTMPLETAGTTQALDLLTEWTGYGFAVPYAQYSPAVAEPPAGADVIDDWKFLHGLATRLGFNSQITGLTGQHAEVAADCTTDELLEAVSAGSRVPLADVKAKAGGGFFPGPASVVAEKDQGWTGRFDVGNPDMLQDLARHAAEGPLAEATDRDYPLRVVCRRHRHVYNSSCNVAATNRGKPYNPAFLNPGELTRLNLAPGDQVTLRSAHGSVAAIVEEDPELTAGLVSITFGYGSAGDGTSDVETVGTNPNALMSCDTIYDRYTGQPRMSNLPVEVLPAGSGAG